VFEFKDAPDLPSLSVDVGMIEQVLVNLVINARDAMRGGGRLLLTTSQQVLEPVASVVNPEARPGHFVCLTVADTGSGMDAHTLSHMFEPFFTTKEPGKGTGLGLATVYGIIKQHQGWVVVDSQVGSGTTFTFFLPSGRKPAEAAPLAQAQAQAQALAQSGMSLGDETILVVEDEPALRELVVNVLELCGYRILQACTGVEALKVWEKHKDEIDLLLTDMVMPEGISGRQLAERLQAQDPGLKVIYTSGYSPGMAGKDIALLEGFNFLAKPYPPSRLALVVRECLDGKRPGAPKYND
jgi:two-component system cell cycle sensor histidine kinase/response regulator CckA